MLTFIKLTIYHKEFFYGKQTEKLSPPDELLCGKIDNVIFRKCSVLNGALILNYRIGYIALFNVLDISIVETF